MRLSLSRPIAPNVDRINGEFPREIPVAEKRIRKRVRKIQAVEMLNTARIFRAHGNMRQAKLSYEEAIHYALDAKQLGSNKAIKIAMTARDEMINLNPARRLSIHAVGLYGISGSMGAYTIS